MVYREETLLNVMKSVTRNGRSILLTAVFAIILVYLFSIIGFIFFRDDFLMDADELAPAAGTVALQDSCSKENCSDADPQAAESGAAKYRKMYCLSF